MFYIPLIKHARGTLAQIRKSIHDGCRVLKKSAGNQPHRAQGDVRVCRLWLKPCNFLKYGLSQTLSDAVSLTYCDTFPL